MHVGTPELLNGVSWNLVLEKFYNQMLSVNLDLVQIILITILHAELHAF